MEYRPLSVTTNEIHVVTVLLAESVGQKSKNTPFSDQQDTTDIFACKLEHVCLLHKNELGISQLSINGASATLENGDAFSGLQHGRFD
jgi:hypothetical protein